jgi:hypothetical protein
MMDADYCREHAEACRESALSIADDNQSAGWLYLAELWARLALAKGSAEQLPTIH